MILDTKEATTAIKQQILQPDSAFRKLMDMELHDLAAELLADVAIVAVSKSVVEANFRQGTQKERENTLENTSKNGGSAS